MENKITIGSKIKVVANRARHCFSIGEILTVRNFENTYDYNGTITANGTHVHVQEASSFLYLDDVVRVNIDGETLCEYCDRAISMGDEIVSKVNKKHYHTLCFNDNFFYCDDCGKEEKEYECHTINGGTRLCNDCYAEYRYCDRCDRYVVEEDYAGNDVCNNCQEEDDDNDERESENSDERHYGTGNQFADEDGRAYAVEIETNYEDRDEREELFNALPRQVGITHDGSLGDNGVELQTPKLNGTKGDGLLKKICKYLTENSFRVDKRCGLHVHLDTADYFRVSKAQMRYDYAREYPRASLAEIRRQEKRERELIIGSRIKTLMLFYMAFEPVIYSFMPMTRRTNRYCYPMTEFYHEQEIQNCETLEDLEKLWYREQTKVAINNRKKEKYDNTRYSAFNFHSMLANKHIEARHHSGTQDYGKIKNWVDLNVLILDGVIKGNIRLSDLKIIKHAIGLPQKTEMFFKMIGANKKLQSYFLARQKKFCEGSIEIQTECVE